MCVSVDLGVCFLFVFMFVCDCFSVCTCMYENIFNKAGWKCVLYYNKHIHSYLYIFFAMLHPRLF